MITHELDQGSNEWLQFRLEHDGASEIAAVMGLSKNTTRNELLRIKSSGIGKEFSAYVQRMVLDKGHEVEAMARPIVEGIIGDDLYPIVASLGERISASCDGLTMMEDVGWENKQFNQAYYDLVLAGEVPEEHMPQVQQCLLVTGAEKWFFTVSDGTPERTAGVWVYPDNEWFERIELAWAQFHKDLAEYEYVPVIEPPKAEAIKDLPAVTVQVKGELTLCNIHDVTPKFDDFLRNAVTSFEADTPEKIDALFGRAEAEAKLSRETSKHCKLKAKAVVDQMLSISEVTRTLEEYAAKFDALALKQEKAVKEQKETRKTSAKLERDKAYGDHMAALNAEIKPIVLVLAQVDKPDFVGAMKNQRTLKSLYNKLDTELARAKIAADVVAKDIRVKLDWCKESSAGFGFLFNDLQQIIYKAEDDFKLVVTTRIEEYKKAEEEKKAKKERLDAFNAFKERCYALNDPKHSIEYLTEQCNQLKEVVWLDEEYKAEVTRLIDDAVSLITTVLIPDAQEREDKKKINAEAVCAVIDLADKVNPEELSAMLVGSVDCVMPAEIITPEKQNIIDQDQVKNDDDGIPVAATPTRQQLIDAIANAFKVLRSTAEGWLINEFKQRHPQHRKYLELIQECITLSDLSTLLKEMPKEVKADDVISMALSKRQAEIKSRKAA